MPREPRVGGDVDAVELVVRVERAYVRPHVRALPQVVLTIRALEPLRRTALVSVMPRHVTAVLVAAVALGAVVPVGRGLRAVAGATAVGPLLEGPLQERIWKKRIRAG